MTNNRNSKWCFIAPDPLDLLEASLHMILRQSVEPRFSCPFPCQFVLSRATNELVQAT